MQCWWECEMAWSLGKRQMAGWECDWWQSTHILALHTNVKGSGFNPQNHKSETKKAAVPQKLRVIPKRTERRTTAALWMATKIWKHSSIVRWMDKKMYYMQERIIQSLKENHGRCYSKDKLWRHYTKLKKKKKTQPQNGVGSGGGDKQWKVIWWSSETKSRKVAARGFKEEEGRSCLTITEF